MPSLRLVVIVVLALLCAAGCSGKQTAGGGGAPALEAELGSLPPNSGPGATLRRSRILRALGRQEQALTELSAATEAERERLDWAALTALWREVGEIHLEQGHPQEALEAFGKRLKTAASLEKQVERARALVDTGYAFALMGSMSRAEEAAGEAELLAGQELTADPATAERLGLTMDRLNEPERASQLLGVAQQGYGAQGDGASAARAAVFRAALQARTEHSARPLEELGPVVDRTADPDARARWLRFQAEASLEDRQYARCEKEADQAVTLADKRGIQPVAKLARVALARCAAEAGHLDQAIRRAEEAGFLAEDQRQHLTGDVARQEAGFEAFLIYRLLLSLQVRLPESRRAPAAFVTMERARARAHLDALLRSRATVSGPMGEAGSLLVRNKEEAEAQLRSLTQELTAHRGQPGLAERHRNALWALEDIKDALSQQNPLLSRIDIPHPATAAQVRETMLAREGDALLVSYFVGEDQVVAIAIDKTTEKLVTLKSSPEKLGKALRAFRREMLLDSGRAMPDVKASASRLYDELLGPLDALVKAHRSLIVIPHGELGSIPFETLVDPQGKFLVEGHDVSYSLSATLGVELAKAPAPAASRKAFVGIGDPVYDWASFKASRPEGAAAASRGLTLWVDAAALSGAGGEAPKPAQQGLARLPGTGAELKAIAKLFGSDQQLYLRDQATEENVKAGVLGGHRIVHIASHGLLEPHYQALALTLNPDSKEDGFLLHSEIVDLKLDADLVVLSACQTGNTHLRSSAEPVAGLALALRSAGARRVVVSLWSVDDEATARLMTDFYRPLVKEGASYGASLSEAKRKMLAHGPSHPYFWAPFILLGN